MPAGTKFYIILEDGEPSPKFVIADDLEVNAHVMGHDVNVYELRNSMLMYVDRADEICRDNYDQKRSP